LLVASQLGVLLMMVLLPQVATARPAIASAEAF